MEKSKQTCTFFLSVYHFLRVAITRSMGTIFASVLQMAVAYFAHNYDGGLSLQ